MTPLLAQLETARERPVFAVVCGVFAGMPPAFAYLIAHHVCLKDGGELVWHPAASALPFCLGYSIRTVWTWGGSAFQDRWKTVCAIGSFELVMVTMPNELRWVSLCALAGLVVVNAVATACNLVAEQEPEAAPQPVRAPREPVPKPARALAASRAAPRREAVPT